jgi:hypothetical protein
MPKTESCARKFQRFARLRGVPLQSAALVEAYACDGTAPEDTAKFVIEDHAARHSRRRLASIRKALGRRP